MSAPIRKLWLTLVVFLSLGSCLVGLILTLNISEADFADIRTPLVVVTGLVLALSTLCFQWASCLSREESTLRQTPPEQMSRGEGASGILLKSSLRETINTAETFALSGVGFFFSLMIKYAEANAYYLDAMGFGFDVTFFERPWFKFWVIKPLLILFAGGAAWLAALGTVKLFINLLGKFSLYLRLKRAREN